MFDDDGSVILGVPLNKLISYDKEYFENCLSKIGGYSV
jgi:hypothetical protein